MNLSINVESVVDMAAIAQLAEIQISAAAFDDEYVPSPEMMERALDKLLTSLKFVMDGNEINLFNYSDELNDDYLRLADNLEKLSESIRSGIKLILDAREIARTSDKSFTDAIEEIRNRRAER